jgi:hypothetical protein
MKDKRKKMPYELGECDIGDTICGTISKSKLQIIHKSHLYDDVYEYKCKYIDGPFENEMTTIMSYYKYEKVTI